MTDLACRYSEACTRAGIAVLLIAAFSISLAARLVKVESLVAFGSYVSAREMLDAAVEELTGSEYWDTYAAAFNLQSSDRDSIKIKDFSRLECGSSLKKGIHSRQKISDEIPNNRLRVGEVSNMVSFAEAKAGTVRRSAVVAVKIPGPPEDISIMDSCPGVEELASAMRSLWDDEMLKIARTFSIETDVELYRWQLRRNRAAPTYDELTIEDVSRLNLQPRTTFSEFEALRRSRTLVTAPYFSDPQSVTFAAILTQVATFILLAYFHLNFCAATMANVLALPGTLFGTLWANWFGKLVYAFLLLLPASSATHLAFVMQGTDQLLSKMFAGGSVLLTIFIALKSISFTEMNSLSGIWPKLRIAMKMRSGDRGGK